MVPPSWTAGFPTPESGFLKTGLLTTPLFLLFIYCGFGWRCEIDPDKLEVIDGRGIVAEDSSRGAERCVLFTGNRYLMWYGAGKERQMATESYIWQTASADGIHWAHPKQIAGEDRLATSPFVRRHGGTYHLWYLVDGTSQDLSFQEIRYRAYKTGFGFGWLPWSRNTLSFRNVPPPLEGSCILSTRVDLDESGKGWLYLSVRDQEARVQLVRIPLKLHRTWYGVS